jgi:hypothetical protein
VYRAYGKCFARFTWLTWLLVDLIGVSRGTYLDITWFTWLSLGYGFEINGLERIPLTH